MEQNIFSFQQKCLVTKIILHFIDLFTPSFIFVLHLNYLFIIGKEMLNIKPMESLVAANTNTIWIKFEAFSCIKQYRIQKCLKKVLATLFPCIFYGKTKWNSLYVLRNKNLFKVHKCSSLNISSILNGAKREGKCEYRCTIHSLTLKKGTLKKRLDAALLKALQGLAWTLPGG